jgi:hypothetical protein
VLSGVVEIDSWLAALEARHLANLTRPELTRALRALSSCYVERRDRLAQGAALEGAGKRAAFALFYGPLHFLTVAHVLDALDAGKRPLRQIVDLGCGTGAAGAAWAVDEANWTYRHFALRGRAAAGNLTRAPLRADARTGMLLAYAVNELPEDGRAALLERVVDRVRGGASLLIVEPIARLTASWWETWQVALGGQGARADEWRFPATLPPLLRSIAKGAGLDPRELTARTIAKL